MTSWCAAKMLLTSSQGPPHYGSDMVTPPLPAVSSQPAPAFASWHLQRRLVWVLLLSVTSIHDIGVLQLDTQLEPDAQEMTTSMGEPGGIPSSNWSSCLVTGKAMPLARPLTHESPDPPKVGKWMEGMVMASSPYAGGVQGPGVGEVFPDAKGLNTLSKPNSLLSLASCPVVSVSLGVAYSQGTSGPVVL